MSGAFWNLRRRADLADTGCGAFRYGAVLFLFYPDRGAGIRETLLDEAADLTSNRMGLVDESTLKSYVSYFVLEKNVDYVQGWDIQGATTNVRIVHMTEAARYGYYDYTFQELLELGCDSALLKNLSCQRIFDRGHCSGGKEIWLYLCGRKCRCDPL